MPTFVRDCSDPNGKTYIEHGGGRLEEVATRNSIIERAARALYCSAPHDFDPSEMGEDDTWPDLVDQVRAVLRALREPTREMHFAGEAVDEPRRSDDVWQAMIDAALAESTTA